MDLLCLASDAKPYGHLVVNGRPATLRQMAGAVGVSPDEMQELLIELEAGGVYSIRGNVEDPQVQEVLTDLERRGEFAPVPDGTIFSRRMVRDYHAMVYAREVGKRGGNPALRKREVVSRIVASEEELPPLPTSVENPTTVKGGVNPPDNGGDKYQEAKEAKIQDSPPLPPLRGEGEGDAARQTRSTRGTRLSPDWNPGPEGMAFARDLGLKAEEAFAEFRDYWTSVPGAKGVKLSWDGTWRNSCRHMRDRAPTQQRNRVMPLFGIVPGGNGQGQKAPAAQRDPADEWGINAWCKVIVSAGIGTVETDGGQKKCRVDGCYVNDLARTVAIKAKLHRSWSGDWSPLLEWLSAGVRGADIVKRIEARARWSNYEPPSSLRYFDALVREGAEVAAA